MDHFDLPSPPLVALALVVFVLAPLAVLAMMPMAIFRAAYRRNLASWAGRGEHVVHLAYRGSAMTIETPPRMPLRVAAASFASIYAAVPVIVVAPSAVIAIGFELSPGSILGVAGSLAMGACGVVGFALLRPSREAVLGARVLAFYELAFALVAACSSVGACAIIAAAHALVLFVGAHANVRACA